MPTDDTTNNTEEVPTAAIVSGATMLCLNDMLRANARLYLELRGGDAELDYPVEDVPAVSVGEEHFGENPHCSLDFPDALNLLRTSGFLASHRTLLFSFIRQAAERHLPSLMTQPRSVYEVGEQLLRCVNPALKEYLSSIRYDMKGGRLGDPTAHPIEVLTEAIDDWMILLAIDCEYSAYELDQELVSMVEQFLDGHGHHYAYWLGVMYLEENSLIKPGSAAVVKEEDLARIFAWAPKAEPAAQ